MRYERKRIWAEAPEVRLCDVDPEVGPTWYTLALGNGNERFRFYFADGAGRLFRLTLSDAHKPCQIQDITGTTDGSHVFPICFV